MDEDVQNLWSQKATPLNRSRLNSHIKRKQSLALLKQKIEQSNQQSLQKNPGPTDTTSAQKLDDDMDIFEDLFDGKDSN